MKIFTSPFKPAVLYTGKSDWYVYYHYRHPVTGDWTMFKDRGGLNYKNIRLQPAQRKKAGIALRDAYNERLKGGWSPFGEQYANPQLDELRFKPLIEVLRALTEIKKASLKRRTWQSYKYSLDVLEKYMRQNNMLHLMPEHITWNHVNAAFDLMKASGKFKNKSINNHAANLKVVFNSAVKRGLLNKNPLTGYERLPEESGKNYAFSPKQKKLLKKTILRHDPNLWLFVKCIYHLFVRPLELLQVRIADIDTRTWQMIIHSQVGKNKKQLPVEIPVSFRTDIKALKLHLYPEHYYLFGKNLERSEKQYHRNRVTERHTAMLRKCGINGPEYTMYGWKHTGNVDAYLAGVDLLDIMRQNRHHSLEQTLTYLRSLGLRPNIGYSTKAPGL